MRYNDCHIHLIPLKITKDEFTRMITDSMRFSVDEYNRFASSPEKLVKYMDECDIEKVCIMSYPSPEIHGLRMDFVYYTISAKNIQIGFLLLEEFIL